MANPQLEDGYIKIATELYEAFGRIRINGEARQVLDVIIRKTYGFHKKEDAISLSQFCLKTGMHKSAVCKAIIKLKGMNIITQKVTGYTSKYALNKDLDKWIPVPKKRHPVTKRVTGSHQKVNNRYPKGDTQKIVLKDTNTKDNKQTASFSLFWNLYPNKKGKKVANQVWEKLKPNKLLTNTILVSLEKHVKSWDDPQFIPHPATWLRGERWNDELKPKKHNKIIVI